MSGRTDTAGTSRAVRLQAPNQDTGRLLKYAELVRQQFFSRGVATERRVAPVERAIEASRWILDLKASWDGESGLACTAAWQRAVEYLRRQAAWTVEHAGVSLEAPELLPLSDGSIDIHWDGEACELLIHVPADPTQPASFYGDDRGSLHIKGTLATDSFNEGLLQWLAAHQRPNGRKSTSRTVTESSFASTERS